MREGNRFSIENNIESLRKKVGVVLGTVASAALALSGCGAPISETATATAQEQTESTDDSITDLDWQLVDQGCTDEASCESGEVIEGSVEKACDGTTYYTDMKALGKLVSPPSPTVPSAPLHKQQKVAQHQLLRQHPLRQAKASPISHNAYPRQITASLL